MRGRAEVERLVGTLEEVLAAIAADGTPTSRLNELGGRHLAAVAAVNELLAGDELNVAERAALRPLLADADRLNALATASTRREVERVGGEIGKVRSVAELQRRRGEAGLGRSCDVAG